LKTIVSYNEHEVKTDGSLDDIGSGYNIWVDLIDSTYDELMELASKFKLDAEALETFLNKSKKPEIRILENHTFTVILDIKYKDPKTLEAHGIYLFLGRHWLITAHSSATNVKDLVERLLKVKNKKIKEAHIDAIYYNLLAELISKYEQLLTAIELSVNEYQRRSFSKPTEVIFDEIDILSGQTIILRRHFWRVRNIINFLVHTEHDKETFELRVNLSLAIESCICQWAESYWNLIK
jgi:magnesium transporter